ncbi:SIL1 [Cervus elaphus hippelaphus]|uniref:Nucleotide exchange factor SIL1 n=1 Tax=Cervus elaphus hippelaphus TaxID=46360 RepID=A0A212D0F3_CEREH|nr:SIL1 [Cervus elaphus hippelaphus]
MAAVAAAPLPGLGVPPSCNPKVQVEAIEGGALQKLLVILATEQPLTTKKKALFALCSLLRHFPYAQQQFLKLGGLQVLRSLVQEKGMEVLAVRVVTLLYDLVTEKALFALCSLLRHFPYAQQQFLKLGGLQVLRSLVQEKGMEVLAVRVVTLLYDLVTEKS